MYNSMIFNTAAGPVNIIHPDQIRSIIPREIVNSRPNASYNYLKNLNHTPFFTTSTQPTVIPSFRTESKSIVEIKSEEDYLLKALVSELNGQVSTEDYSSFEEAINDMAVVSCQNFGNPTHALLFENNTVIMGEFKNNEISFKQTSSTAGVLVVYSPLKFNIFKVPTSNQYMSPANPKYNKYTQHIMLIDTFKRLNLV